MLKCFIKYLCHTMMKYNTLHIQYKNLYNNMDVVVNLGTAEKMISIIIRNIILHDIERLETKAFVFDNRKPIGFESR